MAEFVPIILDSFKSCYTTTSDIIYPNKTNPFKIQQIELPPGQTVKRRTTANKKERRRTQSINNAFYCLRSKIPNVPYDTKLSKIKTLKLAILYIKYLTDVIKGSKDISSGFRSKLMPLGKMSSPRIKKNIKSEIKNFIHERHTYIKCKGRTGWPQDVWQSVLKASRD
ncbi:heart- and neural crest derivatives-expressed protein 2 [Eupeodes corollae]|uniref:heart- and neural crest derivatives-expressed protein 2 n=1 Tax=Eupeodes corollae TaxID=290404 RepID=UPI0024911ADE|nr:heart- and neural crest derivatives-expressed protein 2 [Eupeodes corollae]